MFQIKHEYTRLQNCYYHYFFYHNNLKNLKIHMITVPLITITLMKLVDYFCYDILSLGLLLGYYIFGLLSLYYIYVEVLSGIITLIFYFFLSYMIGNNFEERIFHIEMITYIIIIHIISWIFLIIGHEIYEKRRQTILYRDKILFIIAPVLITFKILNNLLLYKNNDIIIVDNDIKEVLQHQNKKSE